MNKTLKSLTLGLLVAGVTSATYAQGVINFFVIGSGSTKGQIFLPDGVTPIGTTFVGQLYASDVSATAAKTALSPVVAFQANGSLNFGNVADPNNNSGNFEWYDVVVWAANPGSTAAQALGSTYPVSGGAPTVGAGLAYYGTSATVRVILGGDDGLGDPPFNVPQANGFLNFNVTPVPEPSTIVLGGLGAAALLAFRRRK